MEKQRFEDAVQNLERALRELAGTQLRLSEAIERAADKARVQFGQLEQVLTGEAAISAD